MDNLIKGACRILNWDGEISFKSQSRHGEPRLGTERRALLSKISRAISSTGGYMNEKVMLFR